MVQNNRSREQVLEKEDTSNNGAIIEDILYEILIRLPVSSLSRCKAVSKSWYALISDPSFVSAHLDRSKKIRKIAIIPLRMNQQEINIYRCEEDKYSATALFGKKLSDKQQVLMPALHLNGLILINTPAETFVCNPSTRDFTILPKGSPNCDTCPKLIARSGFGFVPCTNVYKIVGYFYRSYNPKEKTCSIGFEVFTLGADSSWRVIAKDPPYPIDIESSAITTGGAICFMIDNNLHTSSPEFILSFGLRDETYTVIPPPCPNSSLMRPRVDYQLTVLEDMLCFMHRPTEEIKVDIWVYKGHTWIRSYVLQLPNSVLFMTPITARDGKLFLHIRDGEDKLVSFDPQSKSFETVTTIVGNFAYRNGQCVSFFNTNAVFQVFSYVESLERASSRRTRRTRRTRSLEH